MIACSDKFFLMYILVRYDLNIIVDNENNLNSKYVIIP